MSEKTVGGLEVCAIEYGPRFVVLYKIAAMDTNIHC